jgi:hypothetical protein
VRATTTISSIATTTISAAATSTPVNQRGRLILGSLLGAGVESNSPDTQVAFNSPNDTTPAVTPAVATAAAGITDGGKDCANGGISADLLASYYAAVGDSSDEEVPVRKALHDRV